MRNYSEACLAVLFTVFFSVVLGYSFVAQEFIMELVYLIIGFCLGSAMVMLIDSMTILKDVRELNDEMESK